MEYSLSVIDCSGINLHKYKSINHGGHGRFIDVKHDELTIYQILMFHFATLVITRGQIIQSYHIKSQFSYLLIPWILIQIHIGYEPIIVSTGYDIPEKSTEVIIHKNKKPLVVATCLKQKSPPIFSWVFLSSYSHWKMVELLGIYTSFFRTNPLSVCSLDW